MRLSPENTCLVYPYLRVEGSPRAIFVTGYPEESAAPEALPPALYAELF